MKEKLELKYLAPYLPYGLVINCDFTDGDVWNCKLEAFKICTRITEFIFCDYGEGT